MNDSARSADYKRGQAGWQSGWNNRFAINCHPEFAKRFFFIGEITGSVILSGAKDLPKFGQSANVLGQLPDPTM
jgi:hypothetical protein